MSDHSIAWVGNTLVAEVANLRNDAGEYQNDATVTLESIVDHRGNAVTGITVPLAMNYVAASNGTYQATIDEDAGFTAERWYVATFKAVSAAGAVMKIEERVRAQKRRA